MERHRAVAAADSHCHFGSLIEILDAANAAFVNNSVFSEVFVYMEDSEGLAVPEGI